MTTYLGDKAIGVGSVRVTKNVAGDVLHDNTLLGNGNTEELKVNTLLFATSDSVAASASAIRTEFNSKLDGVNEEIDSAKNDIDSVGARLDSVQAKIPSTVSESNPLVTRSELSNVYKFKGSVSSYGYLPDGAAVGDTYNVEDTGANYAWDGSKWDKLSDTVDLSNYATVDYVDENALALVEYVGKEVKPLKTDNKNLYNNQLVLRDMLNEKDENNEFIKLTTEAQSAIPAINELNEKIEASGGDFLPLSGGHMTGAITFVDNVGVGTFPRDLGRPILGVGYVDNPYFLFDPQEDNFSPALNGYTDLGLPNGKWRRVYTNKLNNGEDIILPTEGGTLARLEDLEGLGGGDYLPTTGGTLTGAIEFEWSGNYMSSYKTILKSKYHRLDTDTIVSRDIAEVGTTGDVRFFATTYSYGFWPSRIGGACNLGNTHYCYGTTFTQKINAGRQNNVDSGDLIVPTEGGTLARIEDINAAVGDISTALTAILGE